MPAMPGDHAEQMRRARAVVAVVGAVSIACAVSDEVHGEAVREAALCSVEAIVTRTG